jgi:uncharacterized RDD family membrane protein YckC
MKCNKCGNEYPSQYYFATEDICQSCFEKLDDNEREIALRNMHLMDDAIDTRVGFGRRFGAFLIDAMLVSIITGIVIYFSGFFTNFSNFITVIQDIPPTNTSEIMQEYMSFFDANKVHFALITGLNLVYFLLEILIGASVGKMLLGIQIMSREKAPAPTLNLIIRYSLKFSNSILSLLFFITMLFPLTFLNNLISLVMFIGLFFIFGQKKQTLYDMISKTAVYHKIEEN